MPAIEHLGDRPAQHRHLDACQQQLERFIRGEQPARGPKREIGGFATEPAHLRFIRDVESRIDAGFQRELAEQAETERVDRRNLDVGDAILQRLPGLGFDGARGRAAAQLRKYAVAHLGGGLARERHGENVQRVYTLLNQPDVAIDEDLRLARARGGFEHHVGLRIDGEGARGLVACGLLRPGQLKQIRLLHRSPSGIPCGIRRRSGTTNNR